MLRRVFEPRSWAREAVLDFKKDKKEFVPWMNARCSTEHVNSIVSYLDKYLNSVPKSVADFIQGRASVTVGSVHYLAKTQQADTWYAKIVPKVLYLFPSEMT